MATPHVAGLAVLVRGARPDLTVDQVSRIITTTAMDVNSGVFPGRDEFLGWGRVEAGEAVSTAIRAGELYLTASRPQLPVGDSALITVTVPLGAGQPITFTARGGTVSPEVTILAGSVVTTSLIAGFVPGVAIVTATGDTLTGTLALRLLPGTVTSATLTPGAMRVAPNSSVALALSGTDGFGNAALDGTSVNWTATGGAMAPARSSFDRGVARAVFTAGSVYGPAAITAAVEDGPTTAVIIHVSPPYRYRHLPLIPQHSDR